MISLLFQRLSEFFLGKGFESIISKKELWIIILISSLIGAFSAYALPIYISYWLPLLAIIIIIKL